MDSNNQISNLPENPIQYEIGEVCKCYFTEIIKNVDAKVSQQINKCQSFCRIEEKNPDDAKEYSVVLFDGKMTKKKLPGRCLRKVKLVPYTYEQVSEKIGSIVESNGKYDGRRLTMMISVVEDSDGDDDVEVNSMNIETLTENFHYKDSGAPFCNIVMMKADEAFGEYDPSSN